MNKFSILGAQQILKPILQSKRGGLWISGLKFLEHSPNLSANNISAVCSVIHDDFPKLNKSINHLCLQLEDHKSVDQDQFEQICQKAHTFIQKNISENRNVLVHCLLGVSRSASICVYYIMKNQNIGYEEAREKVKAARPFIQINSGFQQYLKLLDKNGLRSDKYLRRGPRL